MISSPIGVVDASALVAAVDGADRAHDRVVEILNDRTFTFVVPALCVAEACYVVNGKYGPRVESEFLAGMQALDVLAPLPEEWARMAEIVRQYAGFNVGGTNASIVALAERLGTDIVITLDRRHFSAIRPAHCAALKILPELP
jgi:predicted nucleic acid-binding protein